MWCGTCRVFVPGFRSRFWVRRSPVPPACVVVPAPTAQYNFTDDASRIMPSKDGFVQAYNGQVAVDAHAQIIVACDVTDAPTDARQLRPLLDQVRQATGALPGQYSADSGYWSEENVADLERRGVDAYIPPPRPRRRKDGTTPDTPPTPRKARMQDKLATPAGARIYSLRKETAEPVFGQLKDGRGLRRFRTRGLAKVRGEWALWCATHNLLKLARVLRGERAAASARTTRSALVAPPARRVDWGRQAHTQTLVRLISRCLLRNSYSPVPCQLTQTRS